MKRILILDDAKDIRESVSEALRRDYDVAQAASVAEARELVRHNDFHLLLLDISLPDGNGLKFFSELREVISLHRCSVIFLTGSTNIGDKLEGFSLGADDYVTKPFLIEELRARIDARLRRMEPGDGDYFVARGNLSLNPSLQQAIIRDEGGDRRLDLTSHEFRILQLLARNSDTVYSRRQIIERIWGPSVHVTERTVDTHVSSLRKKLARCDYRIRSVYRLGYRFCRADDDASADEAA